jgi:hypothetical protein
MTLINVIYYMISWGYDDNLAVRTIVNGFPVLGNSQALLGLDDG